MATKLENEQLELIEAEIFVGDVIPDVPAVSWWKFLENPPDYFGNVPEDWCDYWIGRTGDLDHPSECTRKCNTPKSLCRKCFRTVRNQSADLCPECTHRARKEQITAQKVRTICSKCLINTPSRGATCDECREKRQRRENKGKVNGSKVR